MSTRLPDEGPPRKRLPAAERRELIERAAMRLFTERGYHGTGIDAIARAAGISPPVLYDHFGSKAALHQRLLERTRDELLDMWRTHFPGDGADAGGGEEQVVAAFTAWAAYVQAHPYAARMFFRESTGVEELRQVHAAIQLEADAALTEILSGVPGRGAALPPLALTMANQVVRGGLTELAMWWADHPEVPAEAIVATAVNTVWRGLERAGDGDLWQPG